MLRDLRPGNAKATLRTTESDDTSEQKTLDHSADSKPACDTDPLPNIRRIIAKLYINIARARSSRVKPAKAQAITFNHSERNNGKPLIASKSQTVRLTPRTGWSLERVVIEIPNRAARSLTPPGSIPCGFQIKSNQPERVPRVKWFASLFIRRVSFCQIRSFVIHDFSHFVSNEEDVNPLPFALGEGYHMKFCSL